MKRGAPLARRTPLRSSGYLPTRAPLQRGRKPLRAVSERKKRTFHTARMFRATVMERAGYRCEVEHDGSRCQERATQVHHILPRARGGTDDHANGLAVCAWHHGWIHRNPAQSTEAGYLRHNWGSS